MKINATAKRASRLHEMLRSKEGVVLDKDGVLIDNSGLVFANLQLGFHRAGEPFNFEKRLVWSLNGIDRSFMGTKPIMALLCMNKLANICGEKDPNSLLREILSKADAPHILTKIINSHTTEDDHSKAEEIYWHDGGSFFNSEEGTGHLRQSFRAREALERLLGLYSGKVAILTNAPKRSSVERNLKKTGFGELTDHLLILTGEDVVNSKPNPEGLYTISRKLGIKIPSLFFVGDSVTDIDTAKGCGMDSVALYGGAGFPIHLKNARPTATALNVMSVAEASQVKRG